MAKLNDIMGDEKNGKTNHRKRNVPDTVDEKAKPSGGLHKKRARPGKRERERFRACRDTEGSMATQHLAYSNQQLGVSQMGGASSHVEPPQCKIWA